MPTKMLVPGAEPTNDWKPASRSLLPFVALASRAPALTLATSDAPMTTTINSVAVHLAPTLVRRCIVSEASPGSQRARWLRRAVWGGSPTGRAHLGSRRVRRAQLDR